MTPEEKKPKLMLMTNMMAPFRYPIYEHLARNFDLTIVTSKGENNRVWSNVRVPGCNVIEVSGLVLKRDKREGARIAEQKYFHLNLGYLSKLFALRPDIVISTEMGLRSLFAVMFGAVYRRPVWIWWGGTVHTESKRHWAKKIVRKHFFAKLPLRWITYGATSTEYLLTIGVRREKIHQSQNGCDDRAFRAATVPFNFDLPSPVLLLVGRLVARKGYREFFEAAEIVKNRGHSFSVAIVGNGPELQSIEQHAADAGITSLKIVPQLDPDAMPSVYAGANYFVFPTLDDVWGVVINEALLSGCQVISSVYAGAAEELLPRSHIFVPERIEDFADLMERLISGKLEAVDSDRVKPIERVSFELSEALLNPAFL